MMDDKQTFVKKVMAMLQRRKEERAWQNYLKDAEFLSYAQDRSISRARDHRAPGEHFRRRRCR